MGTVFAEMSSWTALSCDSGIKTTSKAKNMRSKHFEIFIMEILNLKSDRIKCTLNDMQHITTRNS